MKILNFAVVAAAIVSVVGCASVIEGTTQAITVSTAPDAGATCILKNKQGEWSVVTPGTVVIQKSESVMSVRCSKPGLQDATFYAAARLSNTAMIGALVPYVGLVDAAVNVSSGAASHYPDTVIVKMKPLTQPAVLQSKAPSPQHAEARP